MCGSQTKESKTFTVSHGFDENVIFFDQPKQQKRGWAQILGYQKSGRGAIRNLNKKIPSEMEVAPRYNCWNCLEQNVDWTGVGDTP